MNAQPKPRDDGAQPLSLLGALALALPSLEGAKKTAANPHFKSNYADLGAVIEAIRPIAQHGVWFVQHPHENEHGAMIETFYIGHGEKISAGTLFVPADKQNAHGFGSALTYARRYGLLTAFGLSADDDDGNAAAAAPRGGVRDNANGGAVGPDGPEPRKKLAGPYTSRTALQTAVKGFVHEMNGCGDYDELHAFLHSKESLALLEQMKRDAPDWWEGSPDMPPEFVPLSVQIERAEKGFAQDVANHANALVDAG